MTDGPRLLGWVGCLRRGATARFSDSEEALVRRIYEPFKASFMAANALEDGQLQAGACAVLRPDGALEHASGPFAAWLDPFRQGALARQVQALDRGEGSSATVIDRAEVRIVRLDATGSVRYLATLGAAAGARVDLAGPLSARQREVAEAAARCATVEEIARDLGISPHTVKTHLKQVYERLGVASRVELVRALADRDR
jgi:DNA-binding CsgD family transcriptional regulator